MPEVSVGGGGGGGGGTSLIGVAEFTLNSGGQARVKTGVTDPNADGDTIDASVSTTSTGQNVVIECTSVSRSDVNSIVWSVLWNDTEGEYEIALVNDTSNSHEVRVIPFKANSDQTSTTLSVDISTPAE